MRRVAATSGKARGQGVVAAVGEFVTEAAKLRAQGYHFSPEGQEAARLSALRHAGGAGREVRGDGRQSMVAEEVQAQEAHRDMENDLIFGSSDPAVPPRERARRQSERPPRAAAPRGQRRGRAQGGASSADYAAVKRQVALLKAQAARSAGAGAESEGSAGAGGGMAGTGELEAQRSQTAQQLRAVNRRISRELSRVEQRRPAHADPLAAFRA